MKIPLQLILEKELLNDQIKKVLFYHNTDRWYFGDLLRHSSWIEALGKINCNLTVATNKSFISIFENHPSVQKLIPVDKVTEEDFSKYDLVIIPLSFSPTVYSPFIKRGIYTYNTAFEYTRYGILVKKIKKYGFNYFDLAKHKFGQTYLSDSTYFKIHLTNNEKLEANKYIRMIFPKNEKIIVLNPTASNIFTRETNIKKEVTNSLNTDDYSNILKNLLIEFPEYSILIASSLKPNDQDNFYLIKKLNKLVSSKRVQAITSITTLEKGFTFRKFASILSNKNIAAMLGNGTGTSTHFAATCNLPSMSIERSTDNNMICNWKNKDSFQMGSFRWRNSENSTAIYVLDSSKKNDKNLKKISHALNLHLIASSNQWRGFFIENDIDIVTINSKKILSLLQSGKIIQSLQYLNIIRDSFLDYNIRDFYFNFSDEIKYLDTTNKRIKKIFILIMYGYKKIIKFKKISSSEEKLLSDLVKYSNLYKLLVNINENSFKKDLVKIDESDSLVIDIFKKIRVGIPLLKKELSKIDFHSEIEFQKWINNNISKDVDLAISSYNQNKKNRIKGSWQQRVYTNSKFSTILKIVDPNKKSIYITKKNTIESLLLSTQNAGGLIPHQTELRKYSKEYAHLSCQVIPLILFLRLTQDILNRRKIDHVYIKQHELAFGYVDELINIFTELCKRGIYNFDCRFTEIGIDKFGIFYTLDSGSFTKIKSIISNNVLVKDFIHLGINELAQNRVFFNKFKNGSKIIKYYDEQIKQKLKIDLSSFSLKWKWGDHANPKIKPIAQKLKKTLFSFKIKPAKLVYPLINDNFQEIIANRIQNRYNDLNK